MRTSWIETLMNPARWWKPLLIILVVSFSGVGMIAYQTYYEAPPIPNFVDPDGRPVISPEDVLRGQAVFQKYALMEYGSMFGDGADRGPDYTAEALHQVALGMEEMYLLAERNGDGLSASEEAGAGAMVQVELKQNRYNEMTNAVLLTEAHLYALKKLQEYYIAVFNGTHPTESFRPAGYITDEAEIRSLTSFFYWGAWVCSVERPGKEYSFTHNWPYDPEAGNRPSPPILLWSVVGALGLILGLGLVLYTHGRLEKLNDQAFVDHSRPLMTHEGVAAFRPTASQKATYKFFAVAILLFLLQVLAGVLTIHDIVGFTNFFGYDIRQDLPITIPRSWHVQLSVLWIAACWIGASLFVAPFINPKEPAGQKAWINALFWIIAVMVGGSMAGIFLGPKGLLGDNWYWLGHQGWEFVELGKVWQTLLMVSFVVWAIALYRSLKGVLSWTTPFALPNWLVYATFSVILLLLSGFVATPRTNFVIADFWRWAVIHMWAEAFFEVFTTVLVGYFMVLMGLVSMKAATRVIYLATLLFLGSGLLGISHNFYWNAKPVATMALGSVFSTLQVVPLVLLTLEAWRFRKLPSVVQAGLSGTSRFGMPEVFLFLVGVNFWNFLGAGVFGFIINLPIVNYYEHGSYLTVNHGHAALMGVYGNLSIAAAVFVFHLLVEPSRWNARLMRNAFWSLNIGLMLMVVLDLFPAGVLQLNAILENGLWAGRSHRFVDSPAFQGLTWMRIIGGAIFVVGGVVPLVWFAVTRWPRMREAGAPMMVQPAAKKEKEPEMAAV
jgi:nitric oxide reductase subunit B